MPHRNRKGVGSYVVDRRFPPPVGRLKLATRCQTAPCWKRIDAMLTDLGARRLDLLDALKRRVISLPALQTAWETNRLDMLDVATLARPLAVAWGVWLATLDASSDDVRQKRYTLKRLVPAGTAPDPLVADVVRCLEREVTACLTAAPPKRRMAQLLAAHVQAFLRDTVGPDHSLSQDARRVGRIRNPRRQARRAPWVVRDVRAAVEQLGAQAGAEAAGIAWTLYLTGMGPRELWGAWEILPDRLVIHGTKRAGRERIVFRIMGERYQHPRMGRKRWERLWREAALGATPYMLRRAYARLLEDAGISDPHQDAYMGHGPRTMTQLYRAGLVVAQLGEDAAKVAAVLDRELGPPTPVFSLVK